MVEVSQRNGQEKQRRSIAAWARSVIPDVWHGSCVSRAGCLGNEDDVALDWAVQTYRPGARVQPERRCADFGELIAIIRKFRINNKDPESRLRVYVPAHAPDRERREIDKLGVDVI
jgi:hypothetical protein